MLEVYSSFVWLLPSLHASGCSEEDDMNVVNFSSDVVLNMCKCVVEGSAQTISFKITKIII